ncbi:MAG: tRNA (guanosine(46)-N7)-methyltransferase TrmB [Firmicutes bacterium]|nr:tRNA (guanosine(46)-N7)-methyltransferase TrmB [Bacillota bacterium]
MRLRNVKNKQEIMDNSSYLIQNPYEYCGRWCEYFSNSNPIHIEIGMGKGQFIIEKAKRYPDINFIGIEKYDSVIARAIEKIPEGLPNLAVIRMNALEIEKVFSKEIDCVYLNFSDPWPKKRQVKRRLTSDVFLEKYEFIFKGERLIIQKTDNKNLFEYSLVSLSQFGYILKNVSLDYHNSGVEDNIMTEYETRFSNLGQPIYQLEAVKKDV